MMVFDFVVQKVKGMLNVQLIHFGLSSCGCLLIDKCIFSVLCLGLESLAGRSMAIVVATVMARLVSGHCNYFYNQRVIFGRQFTFKAYAQYWALCIVNMMLLSLMTAAFANVFDAHGFEITGLSVVSEICLFLFSFFVQRFVIFKKED